jgi:hypothetical protein
MKMMAEALNDNLRNVTLKMMLILHNNIMKKIFSINIVRNCLSGFNDLIPH